MDLVVACYSATQAFPSTELYGLNGQLRRAAVSVPSNIAEGRARQHSREFLQHISIAYGSLAELETHIQIARRLGYLDKRTTDALLMRTTEIGRMLNGLRRSIQDKTRQTCQGGNNIALRRRPLTPDP